MVPLPLPFPSPRWVNAYAIEGADGVVLIDCGVDWEAGHQALDEGLAAVGVDRSAVTTLVVSHLHPDHVGMAPRLVEELGCRLVMHRRAADLVDRYNDTPGLERRMRALAVRHGVPPADREAFGRVGPRPDYMPFVEPPDVVVEDGDEIHVDASRRLAVLHTPGHEPSHICLVDTRTGILFSGDHVLPRITPVIMYDEDEEDVLGDYLASLRRLVDLHVGLTYPAHGTIVERGTLRAEQILLHHDRRLAGMVEVVERGPTTAWHVMGEVYRPHLGPLEQRLALRETISHLEHLRLAGTLSAFDETGTWWYRRVLDRA
jgi:glyoxylase-like metal-dependent hydrolase (beta-lactamase superfamily II)